LLLALGIAWPLITRLGLGQLPGDVAIERPGFRFYLPIASGLLISVVLTVVPNLIFWIWRR
jgi:hypothetical protein